MNTKYLFATVLIAVVLLAALFLAPSGQPATAAPMAVPTPVAGVVVARPESISVNWFVNNSRIADGSSAAQYLAGNEKCDIQWTADVGTANSTTLKLQFSNDNVYWSDGAIIQTGIAADSGLSTIGAGQMQQFAIFGRWTRVYADVTNANPIIVTVLGECK